MDIIAIAQWDVEGRFPDMESRDGRALSREFMTVEEFMESEFFDSGLYELWEGALVGFSPARATHGSVETQLAYLFKSALERSGKKCKVFPSSLGIRLDDRDSFVMADVSVVCDTGMIVSGWCVRGPELVVEILSDSSRARDFGDKRELYRAIGVHEYWMVDLKAYWVLAEHFGLGHVRKFVLGETVQSWEFPEFCFDVASVFADIL
jgi:Uma2 family endonuclease